MLSRFYVCQLFGAIIGASLSEPHAYLREFCTVVRACIDSRGAARPLYYLWCMKKGGEIQNVPHYCNFGTVDQAQ